MRARFNKQELARGIGSRIRTRRNEFGLRQEQVAAGAAISLSQLSRYENGKHVPRLGAFVRIACYLDCTMQWLMYGHEHVETNSANVN